MSFTRARIFGLGLLVLFSSITSAIRAESFVGTKYVDFVARGNSNYNLVFYADVVVGGNIFADAYCSFGSFYGYSYSFIGEAGVQFRMWNIHKVGSQWIADTVEKWIFSNATGSWDSWYDYNVPVPSNGSVMGDAQEEGYHMPVQGWIDGWGTAPNNPPVPAVSIAGHSSGDSGVVGTTITVYFSATDPDSNLDGIRYNAWNSTTGVLDNNGGNFTPQSGGSGLVTKTFTLTTPGEYYFWTEAHDSPGLSATTPQLSAGFKFTAYANTTTYCTPGFEPTYWNDSGTIQFNNNCYNYSNNVRTDTYAQPGRATGNEYTSFTVASVTAGAVSDGLEQTDKWSTSPEGKTKIALVIWPGTDYHWYRQDANGMWSHKIGWMPAKNVDESGVPISDPETADRDNYTVFGGYFFTPSDCAQGQGHATIN